MLALTLMCGAAQGQWLRLTGDPARRALYFDLDRVWTYNLYEHSRWGAGLRLVCGATETGRRQYDLWVGYGTRARMLTGSVAAEWQSGPRAAYASAGRTLTAAAGRAAEAGSISDLASLSALMTMRMNERIHVLGGYRRKMAGMTLSGEAMVYAGRRLYNAHGLLYATDGDALPREDGLELRLRAVDGRGATVQLQVGDVWPARKAFARLLAQWERTWRGNVLTTKLYAQGGAVTAGTPYAYRFDLGGTWGLPLWFSRSLLTARPTELTADAFVLATARVETARPLFTVYNKLTALGSRPVPFVGVNAAWGTLWGDGMSDECGQLTAPDRGIVEPVAGVDGIVRWGVVDWGLAVAWRLVPAGAAYRLPKANDNWTLLFTATLQL